MDGAYKEFDDINNKENIYEEIIKAEEGVPSCDKKNPLKNRFQELVDILIHNPEFIGDFAMGIQQINEIPEKVIYESNLIDMLLDMINSDNPEIVNPALASTRLLLSKFPEINKNLSKIESFTTRIFNLSISPFDEETIGHILMIVAYLSKDINWYFAKFHRIYIECTNGESPILKLMAGSALLIASEYNELSEEMETILPSIEFALDFRTFPEQMAEYNSLIIKIINNMAEFILFESVNLSALLLLIGTPNERDMLLLLVKLTTENDEFCNFLAKPEIIDSLIYSKHPRIALAIIVNIAGSSEEAAGVTIGMSEMLIERCSLETKNFKHLTCQVIAQSIKTLHIDEWRDYEPVFDFLADNMQIKDGLDILLLSVFLQAQYFSEQTMESAAEIAENTEDRALAVLAEKYIEAGEGTKEEP